MDIDQRCALALHLQRQLELLGFELKCENSERCPQFIKSIVAKHKERKLVLVVEGSDISEPMSVSIRMKTGKTTWKKFKDVTINTIKEVDLIVAQIKSNSSPAEYGKPNQFQTSNIIECENGLKIARSYIYHAVVCGIVTIDGDGSVSSNNISDPKYMPWYIVSCYDHTGTKFAIITDGKCYHNVAAISKNMMNGLSLIKTKIIDCDKRIFDKPYAGQRTTYFNELGPLDQQLVIEAIKHWVNESRQ